jgi:AraC-like DNA-binding protein
MRSLFVATGAKAGLPAECCVVTVSPLLRELILRAVEIPRLYDLDGPDGRLMAVILDQLQRLPVTPLHLPMATDSRLRRITSALLEEPGINRTLTDWSRDAGASARTLARLFVKQTGMTFGAWRQQVRLLKALEMLAAGHGVTVVALELGYQSPSAFVAMFRRALGVSPGRYFARQEGQDG